MPKKMNQFTDSSASQIAQISSQAKQQRRFPISISLILAIIFMFIGSVCFDTVKGMQKIQQNNKNAIKTCLVDFVKSNCNAATPSDTCKPIMDCVISPQSTISILLQIVQKEVLENYMMPAVLIGIILIYRLNQISEKRQKIQ